MSLLLTDEESLGAWRVACADCVERHTCSLSACSKPDIIATAQLKKLVEDIKRHSYQALDKRTGEVEIGSAIIPPEYWQALLKEIE